jgi:hypothetical protein
MFIRDTVRPVFLALAASTAIIGYSSGAYADDAQDNAALKEQMRIMMQRIDDLSKQVRCRNCPKSRSSRRRWLRCHRLRPPAAQRARPPW